VIGISLLTSERKIEFMRCCVALIVVLFAWPCLAQIQTGNAQTSGPCSPAISGNNNRVYLNCREQPEKPIKGREPFIISDETMSWINLSQNLETKNSGDWWVTYGSYAGMSASPVALTQYVSITNNSSQAETVSTYEVSIETADCGWINLSPIPSRVVSVWWTYPGLSDAIQIDFGSTAMDVILGDPIPPHQTVAGWWFFDSKKTCRLGPNQTIRYRMSLMTFTGVKYEHSTGPVPLNQPLKERGDTKGATKPIPLKPLRKFDISKYPRRLWSSPIPG